MRYFKKDGQVFAFDETQEDLITEDFIEMTDDEIDRHLNPKNYLTEQEKRDEFLRTLTPLTRRQFKLVLLENDLLNHIEVSISAIQDEKMRARIQIEYTEATEFHRLSDSVLYMCQLIELTDQQVDAMWVQALSL